MIRIYRHLKLPLFVCFCHDKTLLFFLFSSKQTEYTKKKFKSTSVSASPDNTETCQTTPHFAVQISFWCPSQTTPYNEKRFTGLNMFLLDTILCATLEFRRHKGISYNWPPKSQLMFKTDLNFLNEFLMSKR